LLRKVFIQWPTLYITFALMSWLFFTWKPGLWSPQLLSSGYALGTTASYPTLPKETRQPFLSEIIENIAVAFAGHFGIVLFVFAQVIPTRMLANNENVSPIVVMLVTGVGFPFLSFLARKAFLSAMSKVFRGRLNRGEITKEGYLFAMNSMVNTCAVSVLLVPTVLLYLNRSISYALLSAIAQIVTEVGLRDESDIQ